MYIVSKNSFSIGKKLAEGSFGGVYESSFDHASESSFGSTYAVTNVAVWEYVYKEYKNYVNPDGYILSTFTDFYYSLSANAQNYLDSICCWPHVLVGDGDNVSGFLMIRIPEKFFCTINFSSGPKTMEAKFEHLLIPKNLLKRREIPLTDKARYKLLISVVRALNFFHEHGICVGDFSHSNILFSLSDCSVFFIDCDSFRLNGKTVFEQTETGNWGVAERYPEEEAGTKESDIYKLGLLALRLLIKSDNSAHYQASTNIDRLPVDIDAGVKAAIEDSLKDAANRPTLAKWNATLDVAIANCASEPQTKGKDVAAVSSAENTNRPKGFNESPDGMASRSATVDPPTPPYGQYDPNANPSARQYTNQYAQPHPNPYVQPKKKTAAPLVLMVIVIIGLVSVILIRSLTMPSEPTLTSIDEAESPAPETSSTGQISDSISEPEQNITENDSTPQYIKTESIELNTSEVQLEMGETFQLAATKYPVNSEDVIKYQAISGELTIDETGLIIAPAYSDQAMSYDAEVQVSAGEISKSVIVHVVNSYTWKWGDNVYIDEVPVSAMVLDTPIGSCTGFTLGIRVDKGDTGDWDIYAYDGHSGEITNDDFVGQIYVSDIGEDASSELSFSERDVQWILIRRPVSSDGSYKAYSISADLQSINHNYNSSAVNEPVGDESNEYILPQSNTEWISKSDLDSLSERELTLARNEIYARHGAIFKTDKIQEYFDSQPWYSKKKTVDKIVLSDMEKTNAEYMRAYAEDVYGQSSYYK